jgi:hypothetical protein
MRQITVHNMKIRAAYCARAHTDEDFTWAGLWIGQFHKRQSAFCLKQHHRAHGRITPFVPELLPIQLGPLVSQ